MPQDTGIISIFPNRSLVAQEMMSTVDKEVLIKRKKRNLKCSVSSTIKQVNVKPRFLEWSSYRRGKGQRWSGGSLHGVVL